MEKSTPHYDLTEVKNLVRSGTVNVTVTAMQHAGALGFSRQDILKTVLLLSRKDFYKSMTSYARAILI
jgi:motility quorum-sensing regulator/GCU-specific mRNA interferase toxin